MGLKTGGVAESFKGIFDLFLYPAGPVTSSSTLQKNRNDIHGMTNHSRYQALSDMEVKSIAENGE